uniref:MoCoBD_2 domain-containing protein n=1 Tax=Macrostomum lignano TaxID=282301 RepID=A0A1I8F2J8_9PLAT
AQKKCDDILYAEDCPEDVKTAMYQSAMQSLLAKRKHAGKEGARNTEAKLMKTETPQISTWEEKISKSVPQKFKTRARSLWTILSTNPELIRVCENGEVEIAGTSIPSSNILDLIQHTVRDSPCEREPVGWNEFIDFLQQKKLNVPLSAIEASSVRGTRAVKLAEADLVKKLTIEMSPPATALRVTNLVGGVDLRLDGGRGAQLPLRELALSMAHVIYRPVWPRVLIKRMRIPRVTLLLYPTGQLSICGAKTHADAKRAARRFVAMLHRRVPAQLLPHQTICTELKHTLDMGLPCPNYSFSHPSSHAHGQTREHVCSRPRDRLSTSWQKQTEGDNFQRMWSELLQLADIEARRKEIEKNLIRPTHSQARLDMTAVYLTVQGSDGSVTPDPQRCRDGSGPRVKCAQAVAAKLNIDLTLIKLKPTDSHVTPNNDVTGGSSTSEWNCQGSGERRGADQPAAGDAQGCPIHRTLGRLWFTADNAGRKAGRYCKHGVGAVEARSTSSTGLYEIRRVDNHHGRGPVHQPRGGHWARLKAPSSMGMGYYLMERTVYDADSGRNLTDSTWEYKVPQAPIRLGIPVHILKSTSNPAAAMSTKAIGEPPICPGAVPSSAPWRPYREARGKPRRHLTFDMPLTPERVLMLCETSEQDRLVARET